MRMYHLSLSGDAMGDAVLFLDDSVALPESLAYKDLKDANYEVTATYQLIKLSGREALPDCICEEP